MWIYIYCRIYIYILHRHLGGYKCVGFILQCTYKDLPCQYGWQTASEKHGLPSGAMFVMVTSCFLYLLCLCCYHSHSCCFPEPDPLPPLASCDFYFCLNRQIHFLSVWLLLLSARATTLFRKQTKAIVWGMQTRAVQGMLDFDYVCSRDEPSVAAMVYPFT